MVSQETVDFVLQRDYPRQVMLPSGLAVTIRPLAAGDEHALLAYFRRMPALERSRYFRDDVVDPTLVAKWCRNINPLRVMCLLVWDGDQLIADGTLHRARQFIKSHVAELRLSVDPDYRTQGVGHRLSIELLDLASSLGIDWVDAEVLSHEAEALDLIRTLAFHEVGVFPKHARDMLAEHYDVVVFTRRVEPAVPVEIGGSG
jgi:GNAT superfamily N-acetyltransferase